MSLCKSVLLAGRILFNLSGSVKTVVGTCDHMSDHVTGHVTCHTFKSGILASFEQSSLVRKSVPACRETNTCAIYYTTTRMQGADLVVDSCVIQPNDDSVDSEKEPRQYVESTGHDSLQWGDWLAGGPSTSGKTHYLSTQYSSSIVCELILVENDIIVEMYSLLLFQLAVVDPFTCLFHLPVNKL